MRLTLRTMLAFRDGLLGVDDAQAIAAKIKASDFATQLLHRLDEVGDSAAEVSSAALTNSSGALDANTLASYLDNTLPPADVPTLEKSLLESDVLLAELTECHVILSQVLDQRIRVERERRERMYSLRPAPVAASVPAAEYDSASEDAAELDSPGAMPSDDDILNWMVTDADSNSREYRYVSEGASDLAGCTAVLAPPAAETTPHSAAAAATACVQTVQRTSTAARPRRSESSAPEVARSWYPSNWYSNALGAAISRPMLSMSVFAATLGAAVCWAAFGGASGPPPRPIGVEAHTFGLPDVAGEPCVMLNGQIGCRMNQASFADAGAIVIAWPADAERLAKFTPLRVFSELTITPQKLTPMQLYVGQSNEHGDYRLRLKSGKEYYVLVLSGNAQRDGELRGDDRDVLTARFEEPEKLLGSRGYHLARCSVVGGTIQHDWQFGGKSEK